MKTNTGTVVKSTGSWYSILTDDGRQLAARLKGRFRMDGLKSTNPVAIGDKVDFFTDENGDTVISQIHPRFNYIVRKSTKLSKQSHIIAANIDRAIVVVTLTQPRTSTGFIDRFLVTAEAYHIPGVIIFNKVDLYSDAQLEKMDAYFSLYSSLGYQCIKTSVPEKTGLEEVRETLRNRISLIGGHSGVGKSTLINAIEPGLDLKTAHISDYHNKGKHTTTFSEMLPLSMGGFVIDTPGIKEFGLVDFEKTEVAERFPEMRALMHDCRFNNCQHVNEPGCAVKKALEEGLIAPFRYTNYLGILSDSYFDEEEYD